MALAGTSRNVFHGHKMRRLRRERSLTQAQMADALGISSSYLNLLENNNRAVTVPVLLKLVQGFDIDLHSFTEDEDARLAGELVEVFSDQSIGEHDVDQTELLEIASRTPEAGRAIIDLYRAYHSARDEANALVEWLSDGGSPGLEMAPPPSDSVTDFIQERSNHFPQIEDAAEDLLSKAGGNHYQALVDHLAQVHAVDVEIVPADVNLDAVRRFDPVTRKLLISEVLPECSRKFQLAHQIGLLTCSQIIDLIVAGTKLLTTDAETLCRVALANYFAGAVLMPYGPFLKAASSLRYDIEILQQRFGASFEQVCHRLTTLQRPKAKGVPFHMVRVDVAGNVSKWFSASGLRIARYGGGCPLWIAHMAFLTPGRIGTQLSRMPDGRTFFSIARMVTNGGGGHHIPPSTYAIELGCELSHAPKLVYADGISLENVDAATPIGIGCRVCERMDCRQRAFPPLHHRLDVDVNVRGFSAYVSPTSQSKAESGSSRT